ncbi:hypothetical protein QBC38DRAFT_43915 [Podospora fimiseda]|uniref:Heterokaryon incompatibility domain-containing protein n=1 Tax=Podospora fimiseda TaxID=252190 RepID=A0AAN7BI70_9PEZI|nr:hypothetical protein QBC38DRAFT_43915 [Podospora fimiseda]
MDYLVDSVKSSQGMAMVKDLVDSIDITPEMIKKTVEEVGESPEKLRAILNLWFVPRFKPSFVPAQHHRPSASPGDVEFLGLTRRAQTPTPRRMFDIETGNLVDNWPAIGARGQYCMLSHRWKGEEIQLGDIKEARRKDLERAKAGITPNGGSDVEIIMRQCKLDIKEQQEVIEKLHKVAEPNKPFSLAELLEKRLTSKSVDGTFGWAKREDEQARTMLRFAEMERKVFTSVINQVHQSVDEKMQGLRPAQQDSSTDGINAANGVVNEAAKKASAAKKTLDEARSRFNSSQSDIQYFQQHPRLRDSLDEMVTRLQRWKSAIKLENSISEASKIFKNKLFQYRERRYLWTDTCCIDKPNFGELSDSLSLMGDWYADAEFTLVQLDTSFNEADALKDWRRFEAEEANQPWEESFANIENFHTIGNHKPEWSDRAWTLQELVMSKTTFYVNSLWTPLSRPVESLGYFYHLIPFIEIYTSGDCHNLYRALPSMPNKLGGYWANLKVGHILEGLHSSAELDGIAFLKHIDGDPSSDSSETAAIKAAQEMIILLDGLGVRIPKDLEVETATSEIAQAVYLAAADLCRPEGNPQGQTLLADFINTCKDRPAKEEVADETESLEEQQEKLIQHAINFVLQCLVAETKSLVLNDREYIAKFGQVEQLAGWQSGMARTGFSAQSVLEVSGKRTATVETDRAYALMGVLGVRFTTFSAEGYPKALARLLDEVIITHNDVSVFNWSGMDMGSPIRGRSMYPAAHTAFGNQEDRGRRYNLILSADVQGKMEEVMRTYHGVINILQNAIEVVKDKKRKDLPFSWIDQIIKLLQSNGFQKLKPEMESVGKIIRYVIKNCVQEVPPSTATAAPATEEEKAPSRLSLPSLSKTSTMSTLSDSLPSLPSPPISLSSLTSWGSSSTAQEKEKESPGNGGSTKKGSRFGLSKGLGIKAPSFGTSKKIAEPTVQTPPPVQSPVSPEPTSSNVPPSSITRKPTWVDFDENISTYLQSPEEERPKRRETLPEEVKTIDLDVASMSESDHSTTHVNPGDDHSTISPNPIIVNNSGIEGLFDIQRVVVTMIDAEKLRRQVSKAVSPRQKISGWCSISTGFSRVVTSFSCEKSILERQLDVIQTIEATVLCEQDKSEGEKRSAKLLKTLKVTKRTVENVAEEGASQAGKVVSNNTTGGGQAGDKNGDEAEGAENEDSDNTEEERLVSRMIEFIQEPSLKLVAGEWVLARFSGTPGANWLLCHLELGSSPSVFYGHRIATGEIDFTSSTPEPGLVNAWQTYMNRKKRKMCYILDKYLESRKFGKQGEEKRQTGTTLAMQGVNTAMKGVEGYTPGLPRLPSWSKEGGGEQPVQEENGDDGSDDEENVFGKILNQSKLAALAFRDYTVLAVVEKLFEMRASHLDKTLSARVLKRTPIALRSAVENLSDNRSLMPAMFHSSTRVHMF